MTRGARRLGRPVLAIALALTLGACSGTAAPTATLRPIVAGPTPTVTTYDIGITGWIDGFIVTVSSASASLDAKGGTLTVEASIANVGTDEATLDLPIVVTAGDATFQLAHGTTLPDQPGGSIAHVSLPFDVLGRGTIDDGVIRIGRSGDHAVAIPLRPGTAEAIRLEPVELDVSGTARPGALRVTLRHLQLRWDLPDWHDELPLATQALTITYDVTYTGSFSGGFAFTGDNVKLRLPDGTTYVLPRPDGHSQSIALIHAGKTARNLISRFEIPDGVTGRFVLVLNDGGTTKGVAFTIGT